MDASDHLPVAADFGVPEAGTLVVVFGGALCDSAALLNNPKTSRQGGKLGKMRKG